MWGCSGFDDPSGKSGCRDALVLITPLVGKSGCGDALVLMTPLVGRSGCRDTGVKCGTHDNETP